jgi:hypothetical protein
LYALRRSGELIRKMKRLLTSILLLLLVAAEASATASLLDYEKRVARATEQIVRIKTDSDYSDEGVGYVKKLLPVTEQVEWKGKTIAVDNKWLHEKLDAATAENAKEMRTILLDEIYARLDNLDKHLIQSVDISRDEANQKAGIQERLKKILAQEQYKEKKENEITAFINRIRKKAMEFVFKLWNKIMNALFGASAGNSGYFRIIFFIGIGVALFFIGRMLMRFKPTKKKAKKRTVLGEEIEDDATPGDLAEAALAAAKAGDFRLGVRKLYIAFLYEMSERNLIELDSHATNREYLSKVSRFGLLAPSMKYLTDRFDYFWYGMFPSSQEDFASYLESYQEAVKHLQTISEQTAQS